MSFYGYVDTCTTAFYVSNTVPLVPILLANPILSVDANIVQLKLKLVRIYASRIYE